MKKQFFRVKQLADQTFSRAGKTDVLSDDLQEADRKVEYIKTSCQNVSKKLSACLLLGQLQGESGTKEKLLKKSPSYQLGAIMQESGAVCDDDSLMKTVLHKCGQAEKILSEENVDHDHRVEQHVIAPLQNVLDTEIPNIIKQKRNVTKVCLDMDSAKTRYQQAQKHITNNNAGAAKVESIKDELKESEQKVEQSRDVLASEMFHLAARESDLCYTILQYYKFQKSYHEFALGILNVLVPELENDISSSKTKPVYGVDLVEHLRVTDRKIAFPIELCVCALLELGMEEEGLFRLAGGASKLKRMKLSFDAGCMTLATALSYRDPHVIAGALKSYLRELPEPLLTHSLYDEWLSAAKAQTTPDNKLQALWTVVHKLPKENFDNLSYLIKFFHILSKNHEVNKMSPHNIAIVIAPSLIWTKDENNGSGFGLNVNVSLYPSIIDLLVTYADWFFDKDMEFYLTLEPVMNGESEEKVDRGIDNKGFDIKTADKMHKSVNEKCTGQMQSGGDCEASIKRSQSISSLTEEIHVHESPRPITRRKNKCLAPVPPIIRDDRKKEDSKNAKESSNVNRTKEISSGTERPDKPPRPSVSSNSTLPRPSKSNRDSKLLETNPSDLFIQSVDDMSLIKKIQSDNNHKTSSISSHAVKDKIIKTVATVSTNTESYRVTKESFPSNSLERNKDRPVAAPRSITATIDLTEKTKIESDSKPLEYTKVNLISVKKEWLLGKDSADIDNLPLKKPAVPERPAALKTQSFKLNRSNISSGNYENVSLSSDENLSSKSLDDRPVQKSQPPSLEKPHIAIIDIGKEEKTQVETIENRILINRSEDEEKSSEKKHDCSSEDDDKDVFVSVEERKTSTFTSSRPLSLPGSDKPERPPKPDRLPSSSSSHTRTFSDGQIIEKKSSDNGSSNINNNNNSDNNSTHGTKHVLNNNFTSEGATVLSVPSCIIKHPQTSPPPPPVQAKPRANSQSESTDF